MPGPNIIILKNGDQWGNGMIVKVTLVSGREIFACATHNVYSEEWDLGPTWNYIVMGEDPFLVDTGSRSQGKNLMQLMRQCGVGIDDLDSILISHGHEDHDGGLREILDSTQSKVIIKAHHTYERLIRQYPSLTPEGVKKDFPASCWHCPMPEAFSNHWCLGYQKDRMDFEIQSIGEPQVSLSAGVTLYHTPGHSPDACAILVDNEALLVGDSILPEITPHPTREFFFELTREVLPDEYVEPQQLFGLRAYIRSLKMMQRIGATSGRVHVLPSHRLFFNNTWNQPDLQTRVDELIEHHISRCADILKIIKDEPKTAEQISREYFQPNLLKGVGMNMAKSEVLSHCELLEISGDAVLTEEDKLVAVDRSQRFESVIREIS
jgi:glyoxylase-like metal-dependent hydrolase (beta-lactamase superfamily II)